MPLPDCAELCNAKAAHLGVREPDVWLADAIFANRGSNLRNLIRLARGQTPDPEDRGSRGARPGMPPPRLPPGADSPYYVSVYARPRPSPSPSPRKLGKRSAACLAQLDQMGANEGSRHRGHCHMNVAICRLLLDQPKQRLENARRRPLDLLPDNELA